MRIGRDREVLRWSAVVMAKVVVCRMVLDRVSVLGVLSLSMNEYRLRLFYV